MIRPPCIAALRVVVLGILPACSSSSSPNQPGPGALLDSGAVDARADAGVTVTAIALPGGAPGIGFDDLRYAPVLKKILAPTGRTGNVDLVDPDTLAVTPIAGFTASTTFMAGVHDSGSTSADEGVGVIFAIDHETMSVRVVDSATLSILGSTPLAASPDYVRWVASSSEIWVTEPVTGLEVLTVAPGAAPVHAATIAVAGGPEGIVVDGTRKRVYTNSFTDQTYSIDIAQRSIVETWPNGCSGFSLGLALDEARGFVFIACMTGSVVVLDAAHGGAKLGSLTQGSGLDVLAYSPSLHHLYLAGGASRTLAIVGISAAGAPVLLGTAATETGAKCVTTDDRGRAFVCDPSGGRLLEVTDPYPMTP